MENDEMESSEKNIESIYEELNSAYCDARDSFSDMPAEALKGRLEVIANTKEAFKRVLAEHRADGERAALILAAVASNALGHNLMPRILTEGMGGFIAGLCHTAVLPMVVAWQEDGEREAIERELAELEG